MYPVTCLMPYSQLVLLSTNKYILSAGAPCGYSTGDPGQDRLRPRAFLFAGTPCYPAVLFVYT